MRLAFISDIHGNLPALSAVLSDIAEGQVDQTVCLGDVCDLGPAPREVLERLVALDMPIVQGNHDSLHDESPPELREISAWCAQQLTAEQTDFLRSLPSELRFELPGGRRLLAVHGTPRGYNDGFVPFQAKDDVERALAGVDEDVVVAGHTHVQLSSRLGRTLVVNVGSVGCTFERPFDGRPPRILPWAEYAVVNATSDQLCVELRRVAYDVGALRRQILESNMPGKEAWAAQWAD